MKKIFHRDFLADSVFFVGLSQGISYFLGFYEVLILPFSILVAVLSAFLIRLIMPFGEAFDGLIPSSVSTVLSVKKSVYPFVMYTLILTVMHILERGNFGALLMAPVLAAGLVIFAKILASTVARKKDSLNP